MLDKNKNVDAVKASAVNDYAETIVAANTCACEVGKAVGKDKEDVYMGISFGLAISYVILTQTLPVKVGEKFIYGAEKLRLIGNLAIPMIDPKLIEVFGKDGQTEEADEEPEEEAEEEAETDEDPDEAAKRASDEVKNALVSALMAIFEEE